MVWTFQREFCNKREMIVDIKLHAMHVEIKDISKERKVSKNEDIALTHIRDITYRPYLSFAFLNSLFPLSFSHSHLVHVSSIYKISSDILLADSISLFNLTLICLVDDNFCKSPFLSMFHKCYKYFVLKLLFLFFLKFPHCFVKAILSNCL